MTAISSQLRVRLETLVEFLYPGHDRTAIGAAVIDAFWPQDHAPRQRARTPGKHLWSERDVLLIAYGNSVVDGEHKPLDVLGSFLDEYLADTVSGVHILPFFPYTSDDGFAVTDYRAVNPRLGEWSDIGRIGERFRLMSDLVLNHVSSQGAWFNAYLQGHAPYDGFFYEAPPDADLSMVVRPRTNPLLRAVETSRGTRHVWCTFSHDQVDLDFSNPEVLIEFLRIMRMHIDAGVQILRLDAVAFLWKTPGTPCIHLPQTHAIVQLMRLLLDFNAEPVILLTETNVPNAENLSYFGNRNEAHAIYNFPLPPLIVHALLTGNARHLNQWQMAMPPAQAGCAYLNFTGSHDGIGVRPAEGLLDDEEIATMIDTIERFGGLVSMRACADGTLRPYEMNITFFEAMKGTVDGPDELQVERFLASQTIMLALEGIPAIYVNALTATGNDMDEYERTRHNRAVNRYKWHYDELKARLDDPLSVQGRVFSELTRRIRIRRRQKAFHPNATQFTLQLGERCFAFWRQSMDRDQSVFAIHNVSNETLSIPVVSINLIGGEAWYDLFTDEPIHPTLGEIAFAPYQCRWITNRR